MQKSKNIAETRLMFTLAWAALGFVGCGPGKFGSTVQVELTAQVAQAESRWEGQQRRLSIDPPLYMEVTKACMVVAGTVDEPASVSVLPEGIVSVMITGAVRSSGFKSDCFCHGNPPHCHGDCGSEGESSASSGVTITGSKRTVVDLMSANTILHEGAVPGLYSHMVMTISQAVSGDQSQGCSEMEGKSFFMEGFLTNDETGDSTPLSIDIRGLTRSTPLLAFSSSVEAKKDKVARIAVFLLLDELIRRVGWQDLAGKAEGDLVAVGGPLNEHPAAVSEIAAGLSAAECFMVEAVE